MHSTKRDNYHRLKNGLWFLRAPKDTLEFRKAYIDFSIIGNVTVVYVLQPKPLFRFKAETIGLCFPPIDQHKGRRENENALGSGLFRNPEQAPSLDSLEYRGREFQWVYVAKQTRTVRVPTHRTGYLA